jgi:hypothetical protein
LFHGDGGDGVGIVNENENENENEIKNSEPNRFCFLIFLLVPAFFLLGCGGSVLVWFCVLQFVFIHNK